MFDAYNIHQRPKAFFSPSALNAYLDCRLKFYYRYVAGLKAPDEVSAEIDSALFGTIFHRSAELVYNELTANGREIRKDDLEQLLKDDVRLQAYVDNAFKEKFFHVPLTEQPEYNGTQLIHSKVIASYLRQLLRNDLQYAPFRMEGMEQDVREMMEIDTPQGKLALQIGGTIDRLDSKGDTLRIVDYKTGGTPKTPENIEQLFTPADNRPNYIFQTFLYAAILCRKQSLKVAPSLLYIHRQLPKATPRSSKWERHDNPRYRSTTSLSSKTSFANGCTDSCRRYSAKKKHSAKQRIPGNVNIAISAVCVRDKKQTIRS